MREANRVGGARGERGSDGRREEEKRREREREKGRVGRGEGV